MRSPFSHQSFDKLLCQARLRLLQMHYESHTGHIGGNLSALDILLYLHHHVLDENDLFVLSKGHAAGALYVTLWTLGKLSDSELKEFHGDDTRLSGHPPFQGLSDIVFATGSLGHGLGLSAGLALGKRLQGTSGRVYCLMSDGEWNEGSNWESLIFIRQHQLDNLTFLIDLNGLQGFGRTCDVADLEPLSEKLRAFGMHVQEIEGHAPEMLSEALAAEHRSRTSSAIVVRTRKGCGVSFMENRLEWHYLPMSPSQYEQATQEVQQTCETPSVNPSSLNQPVLVSCS